MGRPKKSKNICQSYNVFHCKVGDEELKTIVSSDCRYHLQEIYEELLKEYSEEKAQKAFFDILTVFENLEAKIKIKPLKAKAEKTKAKKRGRPRKSVK